MIFGGLAVTLYAMGLSEAAVIPTIAAVAAAVVAVVKTFTDPEDDDRFDGEEATTASIPNPAAPPVLRSGADSTPAGEVAPASSVADDPQATAPEVAA
jgi:hypothetical protein